MRPAPIALLGLILLCLGRLVLASRLGVSAGEALLWTEARPWADPLVAVGWGAPDALGLRLSSVLLSTAAALVAGALGGGLGVALLATPLAGLVACGVGPAAGLWLGWVGVHAAARRGQPWWGAAGLLLAVSAHASGLAAVLVLAGLPAEERRRWLLPLGCAGLAVSGWLVAPGVGARLALDLASGPPDLDSLAPLYGLLLPFAVAAGLFVRRSDPAGWWLGVPGVLVAVGGLGDALLAAGPVSVLALSALRLGPRWRRAASLVVGMNAAATGLVMVHLVWPLGSPTSDPRAAFVGGAVLADSVDAWGIDTIYTADPGDAALVRLHTGLDAGPLPPAPSLPVLPSLYVRAWRGEAPLPTDALALERSGPNDVSAWLPTPDPQVARPVRRWQVYQLGQAQ